MIDDAKLGRAIALALKHAPTSELARRALILLQAYARARPRGRREG